MSAAQRAVVTSVRSSAQELRTPAPGAIRAAARPQTSQQTGGRVPQDLGLEPGGIEAVPDAGRTDEVRLQDRRHLDEQDRLELGERVARRCELARQALEVGAVMLGVEEELR